MNNVTTEQVKEITTKIQETQNERGEKYFSWLRNLITISIALFGLIISLKSGAKKTNIESLFFIISILSLGLGILFALASLYAEVNVLNLLKKKYEEYLKQYLEGKSENQYDEIVPSPFYRFCGKIYVYFYILSLVA
jgi:hypothetical protein